VAFFGKWRTKYFLDRGEGSELKKYFIQYGERIEMAYAKAFQRSLETGNLVEHEQSCVLVLDFAGLSVRELCSLKCKEYLCAYFDLLLGGKIHQLFLNSPTLYCFSDWIYQVNHFGDQCQLSYTAWECQLRCKC